MPFYNRKIQSLYRFVLFCFRYIEHIIDNEWCSGYVVTVLAKIKRFMNGNWQVTIFYDYPLEIVSHWNAVLVSHNKFSKYQSRGVFYFFDLSNIHFKINDIEFI